MTVRSAKRLVLYALKYCGGFRLSRVLTRDALRILCYHGISITDEHHFRQTLFMRPETFRSRMEMLTHHGHPVLELDDALNRLYEGSLPPGSVVVTVDDGWYGSLRGAFSVLRELQLPATLYLTTYYAVNQSPVFDVVVQYCFWKTSVPTIDLNGAWGLGGVFELSDPASRQAAAMHVVDYGNRELDRAGRDHLLEEVTRRLEVDLASILRHRGFNMISMDDVVKLSDLGVDVQLHTHRHRLDLSSRDEVVQEIEENRSNLERVLDRKLEHFCYPSGRYHRRIYPWLRELGLKSATTTTAGFCYRSTPALELPRIVDGEGVSRIEFEAELSGILELVRRVRAWLGTARNRTLRRGSLEPAGDKDVMT